MKHELSAAQIEAYNRDGFLIIEDFLSPEELETWRNAVDEAVAKRDKQKLPDRVWVGDMEDDEKYYETGFCAATQFVDGQ